MPRRHADASSSDNRIRLGFLGAGITGVNTLSMLRVIDPGELVQSVNRDTSFFDLHLRKVFSTARVWVDPMTRSLLRYIKHYKNPAEPGDIMEAAALEMGYPRKHVLRQPHAPVKIVQEIEEAGIKVLIVVSYGYEIEQMIIDAVDGNCFILHPTGPLPIDAKVIPPEFRGAAIVERMAEHSISNVLMHIAMIRAMAVADKKNPETWDTGRLVGFSPLFLGPYFSPEDRTPERLSYRVREIQKAMSTAYGLTILQLPRAMGIRPGRLVHEFGVPKNRVRRIFGYTPEELREDDLLKPKKKH